MPWLILLACLLLALQERVRLTLRARVGATRSTPRWPWLLIGAGAVYGGYFGAGMSVVLLAALGIAYADPLPRLNAFKQFLALAANLSAAVWLAWRAPLNWPVVAGLAASAALGGACGGRLAGRMSPRVLRGTVILLGVVIALAYFWRAR